MKYKLAWHAGNLTYYANIIIICLILFHTYIMSTICWDNRRKPATHDIYDQLLNSFYKYVTGFANYTQETHKIISYTYFTKV